MVSAKFNCEVITPMFMAGADGKTPDIRPPSIKGMMRFWWRAVKGEENIETLREEEAKVFGSTDEKIGKSKILLRVNSPRYEQDVNRTLWDEIKQISIRGKRYKIEYKGVAYLLYSTILDPPRNFIRPKDSFFTLILSSSDEKALKQAVASLWCAIHLGGFGTRARRGGGNIVVNKVEGDSDLRFLPESRTPDEIADWLCENYKIVHERVCNTEMPEKFATGYSNLSLSRFIISNGSYNNWMDALNSVGKVFEEFRCKHRGDFFGSAAFGLPVVPRNKKLTVAAKDSKQHDINRRSSPLIFKVLKTDNRYYWMVLRLTGEFLPEGGVVTYRQKSQKPDYRLIDEFWNELKNDGQETILSKPQILDEIVEAIKKQTNPTKIILFGSRARGDAYKRADIDMAVDTMQTLSSIDLIAPVDIVNLHTANEQLKQQIEREGVILYERKG